MLRNLKLEKYRSFDEYELSDLSRVNLLVGRNDCGKTSILEAIHFLVSRGDPEVLAKCADRRGEGTDVAPRIAIPSLAEVGLRSRQTGPSIARFFPGHRFGPGEAFHISGEGCGHVSVHVRLNDEGPPPLDGMDPPALQLQIRSSTLNKTFVVPVTETGYMVNYRHERYRGPWFDKASSPPPVQFVTLDSLDGEALREAWDTALKEARETEAIEAVRLLHEDLESIVVLTSDASRTGSGRAGILLGFGGADRRRERVPLGSHGDGMHRLLALSLALIQAADGFLLIDEIDTGLHWTVLEDMWRLVIETARKSSMQVFATTHSYDCIRGLSSLVESHPDLAGEVSIHKIGRSIRKAVHLDAEDVQVAVEQKIEVR